MKARELPVNMKVGRRKASSSRASGTAGTRAEVLALPVFRLIGTVAALVLWRNTLLRACRRRMRDIVFHR